MTVVVDTNVILVANRQHPDVSEACIRRCTSELAALMKSGCVAIDDRFRILKEYQHKTAPRAGKRPGDAFLKWLLQNTANARRCVQVTLADHADRGFESFPEDPRLENFDRSDRKFVAVAFAHPDRPPILQAADSKWIDWAPVLKRKGVHVEFLCADDLRGFDDKKRRRKARGR